MSAGTGLLWLFSVAVCVITHSVSSAPVLECPSFLSSGDYVGKIVGILDREDWTSTNYLFKPYNSDVGCVELNGTNNPIRSNLMLKAYLHNAHVKIFVRRHHEVAGFAFGN